MAAYAHEMVKDYTWDDFIKWTFDELRKCSDNKRSQR